MSDIAELFARDPLDLTKDDITQLVLHYRKCRAQFNLGNMSAGSSKPKTAKAKETEALGEKLNLDLDLGI